MTSEKSSLTIEVRSSPEAETIALIGEADLAGVPEIEAAFEEIRAKQPGLTVLDLRSLTFIDSSGLHALVKAHQQHLARGHELEIVPPPEEVHRIFELTGLDETLPFRGTQPTG